MLYGSVGVTLDTCWPGLFLGPILGPILGLPSQVPKG